MPATSSAATLQFADFELDCVRFELRRKGLPLRMERKPMELLILLAARHGQLVTRAEIAAQLWSSQVFVDTEHGINTAIRKLRYIFRDDPAEPRFIQTVTGMGYRFISPVAILEPPQPAAPPPSPPLPSRRSPVLWYLAAAACVVAALAATAYYRWHNRAPRLVYTQLTDFTDSAVAPALSPDGRVLAFIRGSSSFLASDQIYVKMLPDGEARRVTDDPQPKYGLAFTPDGAEITYTVMEAAAFSTYEVPTLGGEPHLLLNNASGLVWLDPRHVLFSQISTGVHMGVVTSTVTRDNLRNIYSPAHERGMAHYSFASPDRRWALVVEMNGNGDWSRCRLVALEGRPSATSVGPDGACTSAAWAPNGRWMYFTVSLNGESHVWRQRFPDGPPQQLTSGPTDETGVAAGPDENSIVTSVGTAQSAIWIHDGRAERQLSSEGEVVTDGSPPVFSPDASILYYLLRGSTGPGEELWRASISSGETEPVFPGVSMQDFDISLDGKQVVYTSAESKGATQLWIARLDHSASPVKLKVTGAVTPHFGARGQILFVRSEGNSNFLEQIDPQGSTPSRVLPYPIEQLFGVSPGRRWAATALPDTPKNTLPSIVEIPLDGGAPRRLCVGFCVPAWSVDGRFLFVSVESPSRSSPGRTLAIPVGPGESLPDLPAGGIPQSAQPGLVRGAVSVNRAPIAPGQDLDHYAWVNTTVHRNLYRISFH